MLRHTLLFISSLISVSLSAAPLDSAIQTNWGYKGNVGPARWSQLNPNFKLCSSGQMQSPISIPKKAHLASHALTTNYVTAPLVVGEDVNTTLRYDNNQLLLNEGHTLQVNFPEALESVDFNGKRYQLVQFHFHSPSENELAGMAFPLEIHFVHQAADDTLLVVGVLIQSGAENPTLAQIIAHIPPQHTEVTVKGQTINPATLLPANTSFYAFTGSLTTPPCLQGVNWLVMAKPITASPGQILSIRQATFGGNARPVQALHNREVTFTERD